MSAELLARSALYVPGDAPDKLAKVLDRGADEVIVDLEDAVPAGRKDEAREIVRVWLHDLPVLAEVGVWVRVNAGALREPDVRAMAGAPALSGFVVAKTETPEELVALDALLASVGSVARVVPLLESASAVLRAGEIARAPRVRRLQVGEADLRADLGVTTGPDERELLLTRSHVVLASAAAGIAPPMAAVSTEFRDLSSYRSSTEALARLGFLGRACIHPAQVEVANEVFTPTPEQVAEALDLLARFEGGATAVGVDAEGRFVDEAVLRQARRLLSLVRG